MTEPELRVYRCQECHTLTKHPLHLVEISEIENRLNAYGTVEVVQATATVGVCGPCLANYKRTVGL